MNKNIIKVLLIDDNPEYAFCATEEIAHLPNLPKNISVSELPWVSRERYAGTKKTWDRLESVETYFELKWLQFHNDTFEYRNLSLEVKLKYGLQKLFEVGFVPDIIVFDYALTDCNSENPSEYLYYLDDIPVNNFINPNSSLSKFLSTQENRKIILPRMEGYIDTSPVNRHNVNFDSYGLYCGSMITEMYKYETPIAAIPVTRKSKTTINNEPDPDFFEWFINSSYYKVFDRGHRTKKDWDSILKDGLHVFREEIKAMIRICKIHPDLLNLISLLNGGFLKVNEDYRKEQYFKFSTPYGLKSIPLEGLFIDKEIIEAKIIPNDLKKLVAQNKISQRDLAIWDFLNDVLHVLMTVANLRVGLFELENAINNTNKLLRVFDSVDFKKRILLSYYYDKISKQGSSCLTKDEMDIYTECLKLFVIEENEIIKPGEYSLSKIGAKGKGNDKTINRLTTYFVVTKLWERYCSYFYSLDDESSNSHTPNDQSHIAITPPKITDLIMALFPIWTKHIVLFDDNGSILKKPLEAMGKSKLNTLCDFVYSDIDDVNGLDLRQQMSLGEYMIVKSFATSLNFKIIPVWLKEY